MTVTIALAALAHTMSWLDRTAMRISSLAWDATDACKLAAKNQLIKQKNNLIHARSSILETAHKRIAEFSAKVNTQASAQHKTAHAKVIAAEALMKKIGNI